MDDLTRRVVRLEDRAAIEDLVVRYFLACDDDDVTSLMECFDNNARFSVGSALCAEGRDAVVEFLVGERSKMGLTVHTPNGILVTFDEENSARGIATAHLELNIGGQALFGAVRYSDVFVRDSSSVWRIADRTMRAVYIAPPEKAGEAFSSSHPVRWYGIDPMESDVPRKSGGILPNPL